MARYRSFDNLRPPATDDATVASVRRRRAGLKTALSDLEIALAAPAPGREAEWAAGVHAANARLQEVWHRHIVDTEAPGGILEDLVEQAPRLANQVQKLRVEHTEIVSQMLAAEDELAAPDLDPEAVRAKLTALLTALARHRQRGADLLYEALDVDIGGGS